MAGNAAFFWAALSLGSNLAVVEPPSAEKTLEAERFRIRTHLREVEAELREREVSDFSPSARAARASALDHLHEYWQAGVFPQNDGHPGERVPYFIDSNGRPCAMAYLIQRSGARELASEIAVRENNARIDRMQTNLAPWLAANGFTADEAQRVQPSYDYECTCTDLLNPVCALVPGDAGATEVTYLNRCAALECSGVAETDVLHDGACEVPAGAVAPAPSRGDVSSCVCSSDAGPPGFSCSLPLGSTEDSSAVLVGLGSVLLLAGVRILRRRGR